jgi:endoglucanase
MHHHTRCVPRAALRLAARASLGLFIVSAAFAADAPERVTPIAMNLNGAARNDSHAYSSNGASVVTSGGHIPIAAAGGQRALRIEITGTGGYWGVGITRDGWSRFYVDDYLPDGVLEFQLFGEKGGEKFLIGMTDTDKDGPNRPDTAVQVMLPITKYATPKPEWQTVRIPLADLVAAEPKLELADGDKVVLAQDGAAVAETFFLRNIRFVTHAPERAIAPIKVNQLGYRPAAPKVAKISAPVTAFRVVEAASGKAVFDGQATAFVTNDPMSGDNVWEADFSAVQTPGKYRLEAAGLEPSAPFEIRENIYDELFRDAARFYLLQRCGVALDEKHAGKWAREACHLGDKQAVTRDGKDPRDLTGGWHDAGDMNKYAAFVRSTLFSMLDLYELRRDAFAGFTFNLPESGNGVPDVLNTVQWELDWLLKNQITSGPQTGMVYDRLHQDAAPNGGKDGPLHNERRLHPPTLDATATCASVWARAARTFQALPARKAQAETYLAAAELAWKRLEADKAKPEYLFAAAACLYDATGEAKYLNVITTLMPKVVRPLGWESTEQLLWASFDNALLTLALSARDGGGAREKARAYMTAFMDKAVAVSKKDGYAVPIWNPDHYCWGSSANAARLGSFAVLVNTFAPKESYVRLGEDCLHYLLGRNAVGMSFVSGYGTRASDIYSSVFGGSAVAWQPPPPGIIGGGVNQQQGRGISAWPAKCYRPDGNNWTLTEVAIYYNAPLMFLSGYFADLKP